jgi:RNA polymerase sigma-70 factor (ECF subfamily)
MPPPTPSTGPIVSKLTELSDEDLAVRSGSGDRAAFAELLARHGASLRAVLNQRVRDAHQAEDLAQEVWIKVYGGLAGFRAEGAFRPWLFAIALNHARDALRARGRGKLLYLDDLRAQAPVAKPDRSVERLELSRVVDEALGEVEEPFRTALALVDLGGLSYAEAAASIGCRLGTLKSRVHRARQMFRDAFLRRESARQHPRPDPCGSMP